MPEQVGQHYILGDSDSRSGGLSTVRKAIDTRDLTPVAVKFVVGPSDQITKKVFERETKTLRALKHPNIVGFRDSGIDETETYYLVLDWVDKNLKDVLDVGPWVSWEQLYHDLARPLLDALSYAHLKQIEHRDIKPQNVLMSDSGSPMLADFGIAKIRGSNYDSELTVSDFRSGPYAPPERDAVIHYVRDVYSMGVLLLQCITPEKIRDFPDIANSLEAANIPPDVRKVLARCVSTDPGERPRNASDLAGELNNVVKENADHKLQLRNPIWLRLTNAAAAHLVNQESDREKASSQLKLDLSGPVFARYQIDRETNYPNREVICLAGNDHQYILKLDEDRSGFVVVSARSREFEQQEGFRRRSFELPDVFNWTITKPAVKSAGQRGVDSLVELLDEFVDSADERSAEDLATDGDELFELWSRILDAREDLARGAQKPLRYKSVVNDGRRAIFELLTDTPDDLLGTEWQVHEPQSNRYFGWGEVIDQSADSITLVGEKLDRSPVTASLSPHIGPSGISLTRQRDAVTTVKARASVRADLRDLLVDPSVNVTPTKLPVINWKSELDASKREAVELALGSDDALLVQGPPGTGKTSFIAEVVAQTLAQNSGAKILIASQTHVAVDNALERLERVGIRGLVRLAGKDVERVDANVRHLLLSTQTKQWTQRVREKANSRVASDASDIGMEADHLRAALVLQGVVSVNRELEHIEQHIEKRGPGTDPSDISTAFELDESDSHLQRRIDNLADLRSELVANAQSLLAGDLTIPGEIGSRDAQSALDALLGGSADAKNLLRKLEIQADWLQRIASDDSLESVFLESASVIAGTCTGFLRSRGVRLIDFDLCIVDEASKATLTEALVPLSRARRWVLVGDTRQLPPVDEELIRASDVLSENKLTKEDIAQTLFQRLADHLPPHSQVMLREQYRMIRPIGDMISNCFYDGELRSPNTTGIEGYDRLFGKSIMWLDTARLGSKRRESTQGGHGTSFANKTEARLISQHLRTLDGAIAYKLVRSPGDKRLEVLVIAPYRSQIDELKRRLVSQKYDHLVVTAMTVDAVQGREADIAIFSVTRSNLDGRLGFLGADYWRRINVALSRARYGLTIVGDSSFVSGTLGALGQVLEYVVQHPDDCQMRLADDV